MEPFWSTAKNPAQDARDANPARLNRSIVGANPLDPVHIKLISVM